MVLKSIKKVLWDNSFIVMQGKPILNLYFINKGILKVSDILNDFGNLLSRQLAKSMYNLDNKDFLSSIGLIESIPQMWKKDIKHVLYIPFKATAHVA